MNEELPAARSHRDGGAGYDTALGGPGPSIDWIDAARKGVGLRLIGRNASQPSFHRELTAARHVSPPAARAAKRIVQVPKSR